jgi:hypothetical protein
MACAAGWSQQDSRYVWNNVAIVGGGFVDGIVMHPGQLGLMYARTDIGGAYRWDTFVQRWAPLTDWVGMGNDNLLGIESIGIDPSSPNRLYLAAGTYTESWEGNGAILRSANQGRTFQVTNMPIKMGSNDDGRFAGERLAVDPNDGRNLYFGSRNNGLWRSTDYGVTWNQATSFPVTGPTNGIGIVFVVFDPTGSPDGSVPPAVYVGVSAPAPDLYRSTDGGLTWQAVNGQPGGLLPNHGVLSPDGSLYLTYGNQPGPNNMTNGAVWKYSIWQDTWTNVTPVAPGKTTFGYGAVALDAAHPATVMVTTMDRWSTGDDVYRSTDGGATWRSVISRSVADDSLSPWLKFHSPELGWWMGALAIDPFNSDHVLYGTGTTIWSSSDVTAIDNAQTVHWAVGAGGIEECAVLGLISPPSGAHLLSAVGDLGGFRHDDLTVSPPAGVMNNPIFGNTTSIDYAEQNPALVVRVGTNSGAHGAYSQDGGATWTPIASEPAGSGGSGTVAVSADGSAWVWAATNAKVSYSTNLGLAWNASTGLPPADAPVADRVNPAKFYAFDAGSGRVYSSTDGGATFSARATAVNGSGSLRAAPGIEGDLWLVSGSGLYHSTDSGATFAHLTSVEQSYALGFGKAFADSGYPALYLAGQVNGVQAVFRSDDSGATWVRINDARHQYGWIAPITGDPRIYGRVYLGTNGRGVVYGDIDRRPPRRAPK